MRGGKPELKWPQPVFHSISHPCHAQKVAQGSGQIRTQAPERYGGDFRHVAAEAVGWPGAPVVWAWVSVWSARPWPSGRRSVTLPPARRLGASFLQGLRRRGPLPGLSLSREDSPSPLLLFLWEVAFCFICLIFQITQCFQKAIHLKLKTLYTENNGSWL